MGNLRQLIQSLKIKNILVSDGTSIPFNQGLKLVTASYVPKAPKGETPGVKFMTAFKIIVVKIKFTVARYGLRPLISSPAFSHQF